MPLNNISSHHVWSAFSLLNSFKQYPLLNSNLVLKINPSVLSHRLVNDSATFPDTQTNTLASLWFLPFHVFPHVVTLLIPPWQQMYLSVLLTPCSPLTLQDNPLLPDAYRTVTIQTVDLVSILPLLQSILHKVDPSFKNELLFTSFFCLKPITAFPYF